MATVSPPIDTASGDAFPSSRKAYISGSRADMRVPVREITLADTPTRNGALPNKPVHVYDTSGPYTDGGVDIRQGLPALRRPWVLERGDVEEYEGRRVQPRDNGLKPGDPRANLEVFPGLRRPPLRARSGRTVTQMHYARRGVVTPEMEFVAVREGL